MPIQTRGTAPGLICAVGQKVVYAVPGVPYEMTDMFERAILPDLVARQTAAGTTSVITSRVLRTWGASESALAEHLRSLPGAFALWAAVDHGDVVRATSGSAAFGTAASVIFVNTDPGWRRRGIARAMTAIALRAAEHAGAREAGRPDE